MANFKFTLEFGKCYEITFPDGSTMIFKLRGNSPTHPDLLIEVNGQTFAFAEKIKTWISIEEVECP
jgi:hypothetical protein